MHILQILTVVFVHLLIIHIFLDRVCDMLYLYKLGNVLHFTEKFTKWTLLVLLIIDIITLFT